MCRESARRSWRRCGTSLRFRDRVALLVPEGRGALAVAAAAWLGAAVGLAQLPLATVAVVCGGVALLATRLGRGQIAVLAVFCLAGAISGAAASDRIAATMSAAVRTGPASFDAMVVADPLPRSGDWQVLVAGEGLASRKVTVLVTTTLRPEVVVGDLVVVTGEVRERPGRLRGDPYAADVVRAEVELIGAAAGPLFDIGNGLRRLVLDRLDPYLDRPAGALLAGFLVGDTTHLSDADLDDLRSSGLTHFVAVSGSNVALFLAAWYLVAAPLALGPRLRAVGGIAALAVFVVATRWEPSVVRAASMAAVVLFGRLLGFPVTVWRALGLAVTTLLLISGDLAADVGFQLSVGATMGVIVGTRIPLRRTPRWLWRSLVVTASAQLAVLPVLLVTFGTVPMLSPIANLIAAPMVTAATVAGGVGIATGTGSLAAVGLLAADGVLGVARSAAGWPQLGGAGVATCGLVAAAFAREWFRPAASAVVITWIGVALLPAPAAPSPAVTFLDVGQGDAIVLRSPEGGTALIDGGGDPAVLAVALERAGIGDLDLLVVTHGDHDHVGGLAGIFTSRRVASVWYPDFQQPSEGMLALLEEAATHGVPVEAVRGGRQAALGRLHLQVIGPVRRFAAENDGSVVLWVTGQHVTALLTGDVESIAQAELPALRPDVLQVPHHGSSTTDLRWLEKTVGSVAVISVGPNTFGHPTATVLETLLATGARVAITERDGDVTIPLCRPCGG